MTKCDLPNVIVLVHNFKIYVFTNFGNKQFFDNESAIKHLLQVFPGCSLYNESQLQERVLSLNIKKALTLKTSEESKSIQSLGIELDYDILENICCSNEISKNT